MLVRATCRLNILKKTEATAALSMQMLLIDQLVAKQEFSYCVYRARTGTAALLFLLLGCPWSKQNKHVIHLLGQKTTRGLLFRFSIVSVCVCMNVAIEFE